MAVYGAGGQRREDEVVLDVGPVHAVCVAQVRPLAHSRQGVRDLQGLPGWTDCDQSTSIIGLTPTAARSSELPAIIGHADWSFGTASGLTRGESARLQTSAAIEEGWSLSHAPADGVRSVER